MQPGCIGGERQKMRRAIYLLFMGGLLLSLGSTNAFGQATASATIQGTITDKSGAVVSGAEVVAKNKATDITRTTSSDETGSYRFELLPAGTYTVTVTKTGFGPVAQTIEILVGQTATVNAELNPGAESELIEVTSEAPVVDLAKTDVRQNITPSSRKRRSHSGAAKGTTSTGNRPRVPSFGTSLFVPTKMMSRRDDAARPLHVSTAEMAVSVRSIYRSSVISSRTTRSCCTASLICRSVQGWSFPWKRCRNSRSAHNASLQ